jgi:hypothetical protein
MPISSPWDPVTGTPLTLFRSSTSATSCTEASDPTDMTLVAMTSAAFMIRAPLSLLHISDFRLGVRAAACFALDQGPAPDNPVV